MCKPLILIYVGLRNDQSAWTPEWSNIQKIITKILWILPSVLTMRRCVIFSWVKCLHASSIPISGIYEWQQRHALFFPHTSRAVRAWGWWAGGHWPPSFWQIIMTVTHLVPQNWSPIDWFLLANGLQPIQSPWTNGPKNLIPMDKCKAM